MATRRRERVWARVAERATLHLPSCTDQACHRRTGLLDGFLSVRLSANTVRTWRGRHVTRLHTRRFRACCCLAFFPGWFRLSYILFIFMHSLELVCELLFKKSLLRFVLEKRRIRSLVALEDWLIPGKQQRSCWERVKNINAQSRPLPAESEHLEVASAVRYRHRMLYFHR